MNDGAPPRLLTIAPLIIAALCVPLALGLIGPNAIYGVRTAATSSSADEWYRVNQAAGIAGAITGLSGFVANRLIARSRLDGMLKRWACLGVLLGVAAAIVLTAEAV